MKRITAITAIAALAVGVTATGASARVIDPEPDGPVTPIWSTTLTDLPAKTAKKPAKKAKVKQDTRPVSVVYGGRH